MNTPNEVTDPDHSGGEEQELCRGCLTPNKPGASFCKECGAPLSSYASTAPFEALLAEGHVYRSAVERPHRAIVVVGVWLLFGSLGLTGAIILYLGLTSEGLLAVLLGLFLAAVSGIIVWRTTRNYREGRKAVAERASAEPRVE